MNCLARQYSDQMNCAACGLVWDVNDPEPPPCPRRAAIEYETGKGSDGLLPDAHKTTSVAVR